VVYNRLAGWMASLIMCVSSQMETVGAEVKVVYSGSGAEEDFSRK